MAKKKQPIMPNPYTPFEPATEYFVGRSAIWRDDFERRVSGAAVLRRKINLPGSRPRSLHVPRLEDFGI